MKKVNVGSTIQTITLILVCAFFTKGWIKEFGIIRGLHLAFLNWSFFVLCLPIFRGHFIVGPILKLMGKKTRPEKVVWLTSFAINLFTLVFSHKAYLKTIFSHMLYIVLTTPNPLYITVLICFVATFFNATFCINPDKKIGVSMKLFCTLLIFSSFATTLILSYPYIVLILNSHGTA